MKCPIPFVLYLFSLLHGACSQTTTDGPITPPDPDYKAQKNRVRQAMGTMSSSISTGGGNDTDNPCKSVQTIERQCAPNGTSVEDLMAHARCICSGPFFDDWLACLGCLAWTHDHGGHGNSSNDSCGDPPSDAEASFFSSAMTTASEALCTGTPLAPVHSMYSAGRLFVDLADLSIPWAGLGVNRRAPQATDSIDDTTLVAPVSSTSISTPISTASATTATDDVDTVTVTIVVDPDATDVPVSTVSTSAMDPISNSDVSVSTLSTSAVVDTVSISDAPPPPPPTDSSSISDPGSSTDTDDATVTVTIVVVDPDPNDSMSASIITTTDPVSISDIPPPTASTTASVVVARGVVVQGDSDSSAMSHSDRWAWLAVSAALLAAAAAIA